MCPLVAHITLQYKTTVLIVTIEQTSSKRIYKTNALSQLALANDASTKDALSQGTVVLATILAQWASRGPSSISVCVRQQIVCRHTLLLTLLLLLLLLLVII